MTAGAKGSYEEYFNLGLAYKGLNEYKSAGDAFENAIRFDITSVDAHYELGFAFYKLKDTEGFSREYGKLVGLDRKKAKKLLENTNNIPPFR